MLDLIRTEQAALRPADLGDANCIAQITGAEDFGRIESLLEQSSAWWVTFGYGVWLILEPDSNREIGWCGLRPGDTPSEPELLYGLSPEVRGRGIATEAGLAVIDLAFGISGIESVWAATDVSNEPSIHVMERLGMILEGRRKLDGVDSLIYRIRNRAANKSLERTRGG